MEKKFKFIDLFCGIGGFHQALSDLGGECVFASDIDRHCQDVYERNYGLRPVGDITKVDARDIPEFDVLCGGFPCQPFSKAGKRLGFADPTEGTLFFEVLRIIRHHHPKFIFLENVRNLISHDNGNTWKVIHDSLIELGYNVNDPPIVFSPHYIGIPQHRERVFIIGIRNDIGSLPNFTFSGSVSTRSILQDDSEISNVEQYRLSSEEIDWINGWNEFIQNIKCEKLPSFPIWSEYFCEPEDARVDVSMSEHHLSVIERNIMLYLDNKMFIDSWMKRMKRNSLFFGAKAKFEWQVGNVPNPDVWRCFMQIRPSGLRVKSPTFFPALVAMTQTSVIGERKRYMTPRECARLQSFPDTFILSKKDSIAYKQLGNSVNVDCVRMFATRMLEELNI